MTAEPMLSELSENGELFRQLALNMREVFWLTDWETRRVLYVSPGYEAVWGRSCQSLYDDATSWSDPIHPEDRRRVVDAFHRDAEAGAYEIEYRLVLPDGSVRWIHDRAFPIRDERGLVQRMAGISEDVTERKRAERELSRIRDELEVRVRDRTESLHATSARLLREIEERKGVERELRHSEQRFRELAENIREVFWLTAADLSRVHYVSPAYERVWGRPRQQLYDDPRDWIAAILPEERQRVNEVYERDVAKGAFDVQYRIRRPDGTVRWIHDRGFTVRDESGAVVRVAGFALDITERKEAELKMEAYQEKLRSLASELSLAEERERRRLAVDLHDGPSQILTLVRMKLVGLRDVPPELARSLRDIGQLVEECNRSVRSLTFQLSPPVLHDLGLEAAVEWLAEDIERAFRLSVRVESEGGPIALDENLRMLLFRAVRELLINVAKHAGASRADVRIARRGDLVEVSVADDGREFELADGSALEGGCKGFGLFSIRERLSHLGGEMRIAARRGQGTTVVLSCPVEVATKSPCDEGREEVRG